MELNDRQTSIEYFKTKLPDEAYQGIYNAIQDYEYIRRYKLFEKYDEKV